MRYFWFFLKGFVEDLWGSFWSENAFWSENSVLDFFRKIFLVTEFFGQNFLVRIFIFRFRCCFFVDCVLYYRDFFLKGFVEDLLDLFWSESFFFSFGFFGQNFFFCFFVDCAIFLVLFEGFCGRPLGFFLKWKCFLKWKFSFGFFSENFFGDRIFWSEFFGQNFYFSFSLLFFCRLCVIL